MRQGTGAELLDPNDPHSNEIAIIHVDPTDVRQDVLATILTLDKLGKKQVVIVLPEQGRAFRQEVFDGLKNMRRGLKAKIVFVGPPGPGPINFARQRNFEVYSSLESYANSIRAQPEPDESQDQSSPRPNEDQRRGLFGWRPRLMRATPATIPIDISMTIDIFCCYAREDQILLESLKTHLMPLQREKLIKLWSDTDINAGTDWEAQIEQHLDTAQIILLLVSPDFMASEYCYSKEMKRAMERHERGEAKVIPVILRPTLWQRAPFGKLQALPRDAKPVTDLKSWQMQDNAFHDIATMIDIVVKELRLERYQTGAEQLYDEERYTEALMFYDQAIALEPGFTLALLGKGKTLLALQRYEKSLMTFDQALQTDARVGNVDFYLNKARALRGLARYEESLLAYDQAIQISSHLIEIVSPYEEKAEIFYLLQRYEEALECYKELSRLQPGEVKYYEQIVDTLLELRRPEEALEVIQKAINVRPEEDQHHYKKGKVLDSLKRYEEAIVAYEQAIHTNSSNFLYFRHIGIALLELKRYEEALEAFERTIALRKDTAYEDDDPDDYCRKGQALIGLERYKEALEAVEEAIRLEGEEVDPQFYHYEGVVYERLAEMAFEMERRAREQKESDELLKLMQLKLNP